MQSRASAARRKVLSWIAPLASERSRASTLCGLIPSLPANCTPVMPKASRMARSQPFGGGLKRSTGLRGSRRSSSLCRARLLVSLFIL